MKLRSLCLSIIALSSVAFSASAEISIATLNTQEVMRSSTAAQSIKEQLDAKQSIYQKEISKKGEELQKQDQELAKQRTVLSPDAFEKEVKAFKAKAEAAQKDALAKRTELDDAYQASSATIQKEVFKIVNAIAKEKGYTAVLPATAILYADSKLDITKEVITKLNSSLPKVSVSFKAGSKSRDEE